MEVVNKIKEPIFLTLYIQNLFLNRKKCLFMKFISLSLCILFLLGCTPKKMQETRQILKNNAVKKVEQIIEDTEFNTSSITFHEKFVKSPDNSNFHYDVHISCETSDSAEDIVLLDQFVNHLQNYLDKMESTFDYRTKSIHLKCQVLGQEEEAYKITLAGFTTIVVMKSVFPVMLTVLDMRNITSAIVEAIEKNKDKFKVIRINCCNDNGEKFASQLTVVQPVSKLNSIRVAAEETANVLLKVPSSEKENKTTTNNYRFKIS